MVPGISNFLNVPLDNGLCVVQLRWRQASGRREGYNRREPKFGLAVRMRDVNVNARLLS